MTPSLALARVAPARAQPEESDHDQSQRDVSQHARGTIRPRLLPRHAHAAGGQAHGRALQALHGDKGLSGGTAGSASTYVGMCHIYCDSVAAFEAGFGPHAEEILGDIPNYTDLAPLIQISEVVVA